jgi:hypothetical protein
VRSSTRDKQPVGRCGTGKWFERTQFTIIRVRSVGLGCYRWDGVPVPRLSSVGRRIWPLGLIANRFMNAVHLNGMRLLVSLAPICDSRNTMLPEDLSAI